FSMRGENVHPSTARTADALKTRGGFELTTDTSLTRPSALTVKATSTQPSWRLRTASDGYEGLTRLSSLAGWVSPPPSGAGAAATGLGGVALAVCVGFAAALAAAGAGAAAVAGAGAGAGAAAAV